MVLVRRHLRRGVVAWLVGQLLTFTALVPRDCCALHAHATSPAGAHHEAAPAGDDVPPCHRASAPAASEDHCNMGTADGAACPMHQSRPAAAPCAMTGQCHAPEAALAAVLWQAAVPPPPTVVAAPAATVLALTPPAEALSALALPPDLPPPRS